MLMNYLCSTLIGAVLLASISHAAPDQSRAEQYLSKLLEKPKCKGAQREKSTLPAMCGPGYDNPSSFMHDVENAAEHDCTLVDPMWGYNVTPSASNKDVVDFIVVGAGTAGSIVAARLVEDDWTVALLEAGGPYPTGTMFPGSYFSYAQPDSVINWNLELEPEENACLGSENGRCRIPRGKVLGGTGVIHGMMYMRGSPYDYQKWVEDGNEGWGYEDVLPYFKKSERNLQIGDVYKEEFHGSSGPVPISQFNHHPKFAEKLLDAAKEMGYDTLQDLNGNSQIGFTLAQATQNNGARVSMYNAFIAPLLTKNCKSNLSVRTHSQATKILMKGNKAIGVKYLKNGKSHTVYANKEVIISAGAIHSPQLLLLSGIGPVDHLKEMNIKVVKDLPMVGQNLHNHVSYSLKFKVDEMEEDYLNEDTLYDFLVKRQGPLTSTGLSQTTGFIRVNDLDDSPDDVPQVQIFFEGYLANCSHGDRKLKQQFITITPALLRPESRGWIKLRSSNPMDPPIIKANYFDEEQDIQTQIDAIRFSLEMSKTLALKDDIELLRPPESACQEEFGTDDYWRCAIKHWTNPENHQVATCSMGPTPNTAVVDSNLKVHGVENLRVIDASVMPNVISGNINGAIMMVAEKGADTIRKKYASTS